MYDQLEELGSRYSEVREYEIAQRIDGSMGPSEYKLARGYFLLRLMSRGKQPC